MIRIVRFYLTVVLRHVNRVFIGILRIWHYKKLTRKLRKQANLPPLFDEDDLPDPIYDPNYVHVLTEKQERDLHHRELLFHFTDH